MPKIEVNYSHLKEGDFLKISIKTGSNIQFDGTVNSTVVVDCAQMENGS